MEKRCVLFLVLAMAIIFGHLALRQMLAPPPPVVQEPPAEGTLPGDYEFFDDEIGESDE